MQASESSWLLTLASASPCAWQLTIIIVGVSSFEMQQCVVFSMHSVSHSVICFIQKTSQTSKVQTKYLFVPVVSGRDLFATVPIIPPATPRA